MFETVQNFKSRETTHDLHIMTYLKPNQILTQFSPVTQQDTVINAGVGPRTAVRSCSMLLSHPHSSCLLGSSPDSLQYTVYSYSIIISLHIWTTCSLIFQCACPSLSSVWSERSVCGKQAHGKGHYTKHNLYSVTEYRIQNTEYHWQISLYLTDDAIAKFYVTKSFVK